MSIYLHTADGQRVDAVNDARLYEALTSAKSGLVEGGGCSASGGLVCHIRSGWGVLLGRLFTINAEDFTVNPSTSGTMKGRVYIKIDLSADEVCTINSEASASLRTLTTQDINNNGTVYEYELCHYDVSEVAISNLVSNTVINLMPDMSAYMPKSGGTFTGNVTAYSTNRTNSCLRNIVVKTTSSTGTNQSTNEIRMVRK